MLPRRGFLYHFASAILAGSWLPATAAPMAQQLPVGGSERLRAVAKDGKRRDNCSFMMQAEAELAEEIAAGVLTADARKTVFCPLCRETIVLLPPALLD